MNTITAVKATEKPFSKLLERINAEPMYRGSLFKLLQFCTSAHTTTEIAAKLKSFPEMETAFHVPVILLSWMVEAGGIERISKKGEEDIWETTEVGNQVLKSDDPAKQLGELISQEPAYRDHYMAVLKYCESGKTSAEIETLLTANKLLMSATLQAMFFIQGLEKAGGLEWVGKWRTTQSGRSMLGS